MVVTKLDVLDELDEIPVCVATRSMERPRARFRRPWRELAKAEPVYERLPGWKTSTIGVSAAGTIPAAARNYVLFLEARTGVEAGCISTGPERTQTVCRPQFEVRRRNEVSKVCLGGFHLHSTYVKLGN